VKKILSLAVILSMVFSLAITPEARAGTIAWDGDPSADWATGGNWDGGTAPANNILTDIASFNLAGPYSDSGTPFNPVITGSRSVKGLSIASGNGEMTLSGGTLTVGNDSIIVASNTSDTTISVLLAGSADLSKTGIGTLTLSGANTYSGNTTVHAGGLTVTGGVSDFKGGTINTTRGDDMYGGGFSVTTSGNILITSGITTSGGRDSSWMGGQSAGRITLNSNAGAGSITVGPINANASASASHIDTSGLGGDVSITGTATIASITALGGFNYEQQAGGGGNVTLSSGTGSVIGAINTTGGDGREGHAGNVNFNVVSATVASISAVGGTGESDFGPSGNGGVVTVLGGVVTVTGTIDTSAGTAIGDGAGIAGALNLNGGTLNFSSLLGGGNVDFGGGTLQYAAGNTQDISDQIKNSASAIKVDTQTNNVTFASVIDVSNSGGLTKTGAGALTLSGANLYTGATNVSEGVLNVQNTLATSGVTVSGGTLNLSGSGTLGAGTITSSGGTIDLGGKSITNTLGALTGGGAVNNGTITKNGGTYDLQNGSIGAVLAGTNALSKTTGSTVTLLGANTYSGGTTLNDGTIVASSTTALGTGAVTITDNATLDISTTSLTVTGNYDQQASSIFGVTVASASTSGKISGATTNVSGSSTVSINVPTSIYVPTGTVFTVLEGTGGTINLPTVSVSGSDRVNFTPSTSGGKLYMTANRSSTGFSSVAANGNEAAVGNVLDNVTNPTSDMTTILNTMEGLNNSQTDQALNSMEPDTDGSSLQVTQATLDQLTSAVLGHQESLRNGNTGVSSGTDMLKGVDVWAQGYGSYLHQDPRQSSQGYNANIWGTALGFDLPITNNIRAGTCFGFAQDYVRGKDNSNRNDINSYQWTIYGEYAKDAYYIDLSGSFAYNTYDASRQVAVGAINRTASADYSGEQYAAYIEGGYTFNLPNLTRLEKSGSKNLTWLEKLEKLNLTPIVSFQYQHLYLDKYTETGAGAMDLTVKSQNYDIAQSGFGIKLDYPLDTKYGKLVPELRFKWLYDWIGDSQANTSTFNGGGGSFATNGFTPAQSSWDFGTKLTMFTKNNWTCAANYDFELKEDFYGHYGYVNAKYSF